MPGPLSFLDEALADLEQRSLLRTTRLRADAAPGAVLLCSNDYLGFGDEPLPLRGDAAGGAGASSLIWGHGPEHDLAERSLGSFLDGLPEDVRPSRAVLLFSSGYAANLGTLTALAGRGDRIVSDALNHASIIDGCRLSGAEIAITPHLDVAAVDRALARGGARRRFVVTESYFSMDADGPDLEALRRVCDRHGAALIVDEAHALGVFGPRGRGRCADAGVTPDVLVGTLGKAFGLSGAFVAGSPSLRAWLWNRARSFVFSTAMSPALAAAIPPRARAVRDADQRRAQLALLERVVRDGLREAGLDPLGAGPIVPLVIGQSQDAVEISEELRAAGWLVQAIRPPTVPEGTARLRVTLRATLELPVVERAVRAMTSALSTRAQR